MMNHPERVPVQEVVHRQRVWHEVHRQTNTVGYRTEEEDVGVN
ncbi:MAG: hypothetical protein RL077_3369 [Verrucomicrobiota bacterium]